MLPNNKVCSLEDFRDPDLRNLIRSVFPHDIPRFGPSFPNGFEYRKHWEVVMAVKALDELGAMRSDAEILGVGAGNEPTIFYLSNFVKRVFATDLYLVAGEWKDLASANMLVNPGRYWPSPWNPRRLVVQHMNALELCYEDGSFDGIFSSSSLEHFGTLEDVRRAMSEMCRVLRPGGILTLSTEFRLRGSGGLPGILMFNETEISDYLIGSLPWQITSPLDTSISSETIETQLDFAVCAADFRNHTMQHGEFLCHELTWSRYPHIVLRHDDLLWTSVHVAFRKRDR